MDHLNGRHGSAKRPSSPHHHDRTITANAGSNRPCSTTIRAPETAGLSASSDSGVTISQARESTRDNGQTPVMARGFQNQRSFREFAEENGGVRSADRSALRSISLFSRGNREFLRILMSGLLRISVN
jgi:hypothetical protein